MAEQMNSEAKITIGAGAAGALAMLTGLMKDAPTDKVSDAVRIAVICCVTAIVISYNISRGLAKYEYRGIPPSTPPPVAPKP